MGFILENCLLVRVLIVLAPSHCQESLVDCGVAKGFMALLLLKRILDCVTIIYPPCLSDAPTPPFG